MLLQMLKQIRRLPQMAFGWIISQLRFLRPLLFVSYAEEDSKIADRVRHQLEQLGFRTFIDRRDLELGLPFQKRIEVALSAADGVVCLLSQDFARSAWCQAELQRASAHRRRLLPILLAPIEEIQFPGPSQNIFREIQCLDGRSDLDASCKRLARDHWDLKLRPLRRLLGWLLVAATIIALGIWGLQFASGLINARNDQEKVVKAEQEVLGSERGYTRKTVETFERKANPEALRNTLLVDSRNRTLPPAVRWNATLIADALAAQSQQERRIVLSNWTWTNGQVDGAQWVDMSFIACQLDRIVAQKSTLAGVFWGSQSIDGSEKLCKLSNSMFENCSLYGVKFATCEAMECKFLDCRFEGCSLELKDWVNVNISSTPPSDNPHIITPLATFSRCVIRNSKPTPMPRPNELDFSDEVPEAEFSGVMFMDCEFSGCIRPEWFHNCAFFACRFPDNGVATKIKELGNQVEEQSFHAD
jgi:uncharacterized protein YjbI with pentapeptide repeats